MAWLTALIRRFALWSYFVLAFLFTWALLPLAATSIAVSLAALCGPAAAALVVTACERGGARKAFLERLTDWRLSPRWYVSALLLPLVISALRSGLEYALGAHGAIELQPVSVLGATVFLLVAGEEIGWRGFALPRLLGRVGPWGASVILGIAWAFWHLPLFYMPAMPQFGTPFPAFIVYTIALSLILTALATVTRGSVVIATAFHGAVNTFGLVNAAADPQLRGWTNAVTYGLAALVAGLAVFRRKSL